MLEQGASGSNFTSTELILGITGQVTLHDYVTNAVMDPMPIPASEMLPLEGSYRTRVSPNPIRARPLIEIDQFTDSYFDSNVAEHVIKDTLQSDVSIPLDIYQDCAKKLTTPYRPENAPPTASSSQNAATTHLHVCEYVHRYPLLTLQGLLNLDDFPRRRWRIIPEDFNPSDPSVVFSIFRVQRTITTHRPEWSDSMLVLVVPPWVMTLDDFRAFSSLEQVRDLRCSTKLGEKYGDNCRPTPLESLWSLIYDACEERHVQTFALTSYDHWVFGGFTFEFDRCWARISSVRHCYSRDPTILHTLMFFARGVDDLELRDVGLSSDWSELTMDTSVSRRSGLKRKGVPDVLSINIPNKRSSSGSHPSASSSHSISPSEPHSASSSSSSSSSTSSSGQTLTRQGSGSHRRRRHRRPSFSNRRAEALGPSHETNVEASQYISRYLLEREHTPTPIRTRTRTQFPTPHLVDEEWADSTHGREISSNTQEETAANVWPHSYLRESITNPDSNAASSYDDEGEEDDSMEQDDYEHDYGDDCMTPRMPSRTPSLGSEDEGSSETREDEQARHSPGDIQSASHFLSGDEGVLRSSTTGRSHLDFEGLERTKADLAMLSGGGIVGETSQRFGAPVNQLTEEQYRAELSYLADQSLRTMESHFEANPALDYLAHGGIPEMLGFTPMPYNTTGRITSHTLETNNMIRWDMDDREGDRSVFAVGGALADHLRTLDSPQPAVSPLENVSAMPQSFDLTSPVDMASLLSGRTDPYMEWKDLLGGDRDRIMEEYARAAESVHGSSRDIGDVDVDADVHSADAEGETDPNPDVEIEVGVDDQRTECGSEPALYGTYSYRRSNQLQSLNQHPLNSAQSSFDSLFDERDGDQLREEPDEDARSNSPYSVGSGGTLVDPQDAARRTPSLSREASPYADAPSPVTVVNEALVDDGIFEREMTLPPETIVLSFASELAHDHDGRIRGLLERYNANEEQINGWRRAMPDGENAWDEEIIEDRVTTSEALLAYVASRPWLGVQRRLARNGLQAYLASSSKQNGNVDGEAPEDLSDAESVSEVENILDSASMVSSAASLSPLDHAEIRAIIAQSAKGHQI